MEGNHRKMPDYTYSQIQNKLKATENMQEDMLRFTIQFAFVCAFTITWPPLPSVAFFENVLSHKLIGYRHLHLARRPFPVYVDGSGIWNTFFQGIVFLSCSINSGLAVFGMLPMRVWDDEDKFKAFIFFEHLLILLIIAAYAVVPARPKRAQKCDEYNTEHISLLLDPHHRKREARMAPPGQPLSASKTFPGCLL